jgi:replicative DNA helicase
MTESKELIPVNPARAPRLRVVAVEGDGGGRMPHSIEAEEALLSLCLLDGAAMLARCGLAGVTEKSFYAPRHGVLFACVAEMAAKNQPVAIETVAEELKLTRRLDSIGGYEFLMQVSAKIPTSVQAGFFVGRVRELELLRAAMRGGQGLVEAVAAYPGDLSGFLSGWALKFQRLADLALRGQRESLRERVEKRLAHTLEAAAGKVDRSRWLSTGLAWLDACILPFDVKQEDWYVIIGGPPSGGKSSIMRHIAVHNCDQDKRGAVFLLETGLRWLDAAAASAARVNLREIDRAMPERMAAFRARYEQLIGYTEERLWLYEDLVYVEDIERQIREINRTLFERDLTAGVPPEEARGLDFVVVDYLQIVTTRQNFRGHREQVVAHVSMTLKRLFKKLNITGFVGAQINRSSRENPDNPPTLAALRESGAIEQDADRVLFVHTPSVNRAGVKQDGNNGTDEVDIVQRKSRNGPRDVSVTVLFHKPFTLYEPASQLGAVRPAMPKPPGGYKREGER